MYLKVDSAESEPMAESIMRGGKSHLAKSCNFVPILVEFDPFMMAL